MIYLIDVGDSCNLSCPHCFTGNGMMPKTNDKISLDDFKSLVDKIIKEEPFSMIGFMNWREPFLHPHIGSFFEYVHRNNLPYILSSNLSLPNINDSLSAFAKYANPYCRIFCSISGITQQVYQKYHKGGNIGQVLSNLKKLIDFRAQSGTKFTITLRYLKFVENEHEVKLAKEIAYDLGIDIEILHGGGLPDIADGPTPLGNPFTDLLKRIPWIDHTECCNSSTCPQIDTTLSLDCRGKAYLCCYYPYEEKYYLGNFFKSSTRDLLEKMRSHYEFNRCPFWCRQNGREYTKVGELLSTAFDYKGANMAFTKAIEHRPFLLENYLRLSDFFVEYDETELSIKILREALIIFPDNSDLSKRLTQLKVKKKRGNENETLCKKSGSLEDSAEYNRKLSIQKAKNALYFEALYLIDRAIQINNSSEEMEPSILFVHKARLLLQTSGLSQSMKYLNEMLSHEPDNKHFSDLLALLSNSSLNALLRFS